MTTNTERFWNANFDELKLGYSKHDHTFTCLLCGTQTEQGVIYALHDNFYDAEKFMRIHIETAHQSVFDYLISLDKKMTGLTEHQNSLLRLFYQGKNDAQIQMEMDIGSASTIRNHRFVLKEKERQAKVFLAMMELLKEKDQHAPEIINYHQTATMIDDRYNMTQDEADKVLKKYFPDGPDGPLLNFTMKEKYKIVILTHIAKLFQHGQLYTEKEVNAVLKNLFDDYVTLRRYLIEYGFLDRKDDCSQYWVKN
ncbi:MAG: DUF2087 domain-containing protein [Candidatus Cohnella colombiensis]|uniref:DUF2087 domain-containing protein n=1 Tax=Candidatus Cohnella colombiensis TaxID=3121368 RepID=A0AA95F007_9BACL|nr:MAG: DUF2087 domain-containing protein [Cohnella sp.]